jgi:type I restriction enzyme S subunit
VTNDCPTTELGEVVEITSGYAFKSTLFNTDRIGLPIIRVRDVNSGFSGTYYSGEYAEDFVIRNGDLLVSMDGDFQAVTWRHGTALLNQRVCRLQADETVLDQAYLLHILPMKLLEIHRRTSFATVKHLSVRSIETIEIPIPPLPEQKRIAAILDKADGLRRKRRETIAKLDTLIQSIFLDMFGDPVTNPKGWETIRLDSLIVDGPQNGVYKPSSAYGSGTLIVRIDAFDGGVLHGIHNLKRVQIGNGEIAKYSLQQNDILINRVNSRSHLGKCALVPSLAEKTVFESNMMRFHVDDKQVAPRFLVEMLCHPATKRQILNAAKDAVNQSSINQHDVCSFCIPLPPRDLQETFTRQMAQILQHRKEMAEQSEHMSRMFISIQQTVFLGRT